MASGYFVPSTMALLSWDIEDSHIQKITLPEALTTERPPSPGQATRVKEDVIESSRHEEIDCN